MQIENLSDVAARELLKRLIREMYKEPHAFDHDESEEDAPSGAKRMLIGITNVLDELDGDDYFRSDGWRHYYGLENEF
jgi:hypothetical protein